MSKIYSMTGFAAGSIQHGNSEISCEIRCHNSRYLEMNVRLPLIIKDLEDGLKTIIREKISRGKVSCSITFSSQETLMQNLKVRRRDPDVQKPDRSNSRHRRDKRADEDIRHPGI